MASFEITIIAILVMIFLGYFLKRIDLLNISDVNTLNKIVINVTMPCLIFSALYTADLSSIGKLAIMPLVGLIVSSFSGIIAYSILTFKRYPKKEKWSIMVPIILGNTAFLGFPLTLGIFGDIGLIRAIFYDISSLIVFLSLSVILMFNFGGSFKTAIKKVLSFPVLWAVTFGIFFNLIQLSIGDLPLKVIDYLAAASIPLIMISLGLSLQFKNIKRSLKVATFATVIKLLIGPLIALIIVTILGLTGIEHTIAIIEAGMPSGMLTLVLAINYDLDFKLTADCVVITTVMSLISLPILIGLL
ncbi:putative transporter YfdV [Methanobrevibacter cuticularis]|uniref:Putative transporter YfdV n=1 Tax=Methanobrevibacter cuticularis TaxID=47311 RepID=A0A166E087_9EURY|nr:AEC family transporter [Methanobrevibacter cuticularis]KZX16138.1 putative transporter YfdV [Methanobrevibacter cuticularis]